MHLHLSSQYYACAQTYRLTLASRFSSSVRAAKDQAPELVQKKLARRAEVTSGVLERATTPRCPKGIKTSDAKMAERPILFFLNLVVAQIKIGAHMILKMENFVQQEKLTNNLQNYNHLT